MLQDIIRKRKSGSKSVLPPFRYHPSPRPQLQAFCQSMQLRQNFFSQRVIKDCNKLPQDVVDAPSVKSFKNRLDTHIGRTLDMDIKGSACLSPSLYKYKYKYYQSVQQSRRTVARHR